MEELPGVWDDFRFPGAGGGLDSWPKGVVFAVALEYYR